MMQRRAFLYDAIALVTAASCSGGEPPDRQAAVVSGGPQSQEDAALNPSDIGGADAVALRRLSQQIVDAANSVATGQDLDRLMSYFHPDVVYLVPSRPPIVGRDAVRAYYDGIHTRWRKDGRYLYLKGITHQVVVSGDWAWTYGETHAVMSPLGETPVIAPDALPGSKHLGIYKRENGQWLRYRQIRNGNTPETNF